MNGTQPRQNESVAAVVAERSISQKLAGPKTALLIVAIAWIGLMPWRPVLSCNDWAFYDSVFSTIATGRAVVNDYLYPSTIGLTVPAAALTLLIGNPWVACMSLTGVLGFLAPISIWQLLSRLKIENAQIFRALLVLAMFPLFLDKWTRFESEVPAFGLGLLSLMLLWRAAGTQGTIVRVLCSALVLTWAVLIRQNHLVLIAAAPLLLKNPNRYLKIVIFSCTPLIGLLLYHWLRIAPLALNEQLLPRIVTIVTHFSIIRLCTPAFCSGAAFLLLLIAAPGQVRRLLQSLTTLRWGIGIISFTLLFAAVRSNISILAPTLHVSHLSFLSPYPLAAVTLVGALVFPVFLPSRVDWKQRSAGGIFFVIALGYLAAVLVYGGFWDYYMLEPAFFLFLSGLTLRPSLTIPNRSRWVDAFCSSGFLLVFCSGVAILVTGLFSPRHEVWIGIFIGSFLILLKWLMSSSLQNLLKDGQILSILFLPLFLLSSWYLEREEIDLQTNTLLIIENAFRDKLTSPAEISAPYGLTSWSTFTYKRELYVQGKSNNLSAWELWTLPHNAELRWNSRFGHDIVRHHRETLLSTGAASIAFRDRQWTLWRICCDESKTHFAHKFLPLNSSEWQASRTH